MTCPRCGCSVQASVLLDCNVSREDDIIPKNSGEFRLYCGDDCGWEIPGGDFEGGWPSRNDVIKALENIDYLAVALEATFEKENT